MRDLFRNAVHWERAAGVCETHGPFEAHVRSGMAAMCPTCLHGQIVRAAQAELAEGQKPHLRQIAHIPARFADCRLNNYQPKDATQAQAKAGLVEFVQSFPDRIGGALLIGPVGTGKTHLATAVAWAVIDKYALHVRYTRASAMVEEIRRGYGNEDGVTKAGQLALFIRPRLLILDELDRVRGTADELRLLSDVIFARHEARRPTVAISNSNYPELVERLGEAELDRLVDGAMVFTVLGDSNRGPIA